MLNTGLASRIVEFIQQQSLLGIIFDNGTCTEFKAYHPFPTATSVCLYQASFADIHVQTCAMLQVIKYIQIARNVRDHDH